MKEFLGCVVQARDVKRLFLGVSQIPLLNVAYMKVRGMKLFKSAEIEARTSGVNFMHGQ
jgi:hypothetical protein